ncbi:5-oxoprolinase subunit PxpA [Litorihabitans aurantiacus]|uniref:Carboxyltransferase domain-containing protein n=1 Tax=Litorihabitans aurantiacus TaxID=1930061 RepID=A0AA37UUV3_9MICO|nr:hypothetical protein GCM10025875_07330 [Litorihabitans aurantiacus]
MAASASSAVTVDLNADLGEGVGDDAAILEVVTSTSIACGGHRGDAASMREAVRLAHARGVVVGAHPSYVDREGFGRRRLDVAPDLLLAQVLAQVRDLETHARAVGTRVRFLKAHGALYNVAMVDDGVARLVLEVAERALPETLPVLGLPGSVLARLAAERGVPFAAEAFADRGYAADGTLLPRGEPGALLTEPAEIAARVPALAERARTICVHGDSPDALALARAARDGLAAAGWRCARSSSPTPMRSRCYGERDVLVDVASAAVAHVLAEQLRGREGVLDVVPAARTLLVRCAEPAEALDLAAELAEKDEPAADVGPGGGREVVIEVVYDGQDLARVADLAGLGVDEVIRRQTGATYTAAFAGFAPGFCYLEGLDPALATPRLDVPRTRVPAGSVAVAAGMTAVYPRASPGGWNLLGRTDAVLFDLERETPALIEPGDRVRFVDLTARRRGRA